MKRQWLAVSAALIVSLSGAPVRAADAPPPATTILIAGFIGDRHAYGCGVIVEDAGRTITILTARHVLDIVRPEYITVGGERLSIASASAVDGHDLAVVIAERPRRGFEIARFAPAPRPGAQLHLWGPIKDVPFTAQAATLRDIDERVTDAPEDSLAMNCDACDHGDSGTGVYDENDRLIGIVTRGYFAGGKKLFVLIERLPAAKVARADTAGR
ncbi:MAG: hypothetical protein NVSMB64_27350 [Candidatus Velthaea sp.]